MYSETTSLYGNSINSETQKTKWLLSVTNDINVAESEKEDELTLKIRPYTQTLITVIKSHK